MAVSIVDVIAASSCLAMYMYMQFFELTKN